MVVLLVVLGVGLAGVLLTRSHGDTTPTASAGSAPTESDVAPLASVPTTATSPATDAPTSSSPAGVAGPVAGQGVVTVHVAGKVADPGVVELPTGSRVVDALGGTLLGVGVVVLASDWAAVPRTPGGWGLVAVGAAAVVVSAYIRSHP